MLCECGLLFCGRCCRVTESSDTESVMDAMDDSTGEEATGVEAVSGPDDAEEVVLERAVAFLPGRRKDELMLARGFESCRAELFIFGVCF
mmetsp:Transcript_27042/g.52015  ORF Transcript_27042/g.52015 Transcript_27042/m.52015 type:complete len:90 (-) Transcript_27042:8-277(-)